MVIEEVKEKYDSLREIGFYPNNSSFILCDYIKNENNEKELEIIPLANNFKNIKIDRKGLILTDTYGKVLLRFDDLKNDNTVIKYVNDNDIIIGDYIVIAPKMVKKRMFKKIDHYSYDGKELTKVNNLYDGNNKRLELFEFPNDKKDTILIETRKNLIPSSILYSVKEKKYITPPFINLEEVDNTNGNIFKFIDRINCSLVINNISYASTIIGFVSIDGKFYNGVFDELTNKEIECELNSKPDFEEYYELREMIKGKLNEKVVKESNKKTTKEFILKKIENKAKNIIK